MISNKLVLDCQLHLGEGLVWDKRTSSFWFVDIHRKKIVRYTLTDGSRLAWDVPQRIGWLIPEAGKETWIGGLQEGFARLDLGQRTLGLEWLARPFSDRPHLRLNDAKADHLGNIWAGSMNNDDESQPDGELLRLSPGGALTSVDAGYCVTNGPAISPGSSLLLHTDSARRTIYAFDFDKESATVCGKRIWRVFGYDEGFPDGMNFDADGNVWIAHWGAGLVSCFSISGVLLKRVKLPVSNVTNLAFGGEHLNRLFVTTARAGLSAAELVNEPLAGSLFEIFGHESQGLAACAFGSLPSDANVSHGAVALQRAHTAATPNDE